eukprot:1145299-Pelagomonas_calceolata.AAC.4
MGPSWGKGLLGARWWRTGGESGHPRSIADNPPDLLANDDNDHGDNDLWKTTRKLKQSTNVSHRIRHAPSTTIAIPQKESKVKAFIHCMGGSFVMASSITATTSQNG